VRHHTLRLFIRSAPGFPTSPLSSATTYVVLPKENHMQLVEAATPDRKSGGAQPRDLQFRGPFLEMFFDSASLTIVIPPVPACRGTEAIPGHHPLVVCRLARPLTSQHLWLSKT
jgi:hypothetical protein